jgi:MinD-like ATPase involved in chromosome partitioning or flagellar assembly
MMTFDRALPELLLVCETDPAFTATNEVEFACAVRDPRGRVRLVVHPSRALVQADVEAMKARIEAALVARLAGFFVPPVLTTRDAGAGGKVAHVLLDRAQPWTDATYEDPARGSPVRPVPRRWRLLERRMTKQGWLDPKKAEEPWPLRAPQRVVTFYSFKGGVGRTTALVSCALQLAEEGQRVAIVDLDLEAPGLGPLLEVDTERGVLDAIVDHLATGRIDLQGLHASPQTLGADVASRIDVLPAGRLDDGFLEKLARLDFSAVGPWGGEETVPVHRALRALLEAVRRDLSPAYILLDARAGLHDLAGLSLHGLAHVDVLVTRASEQAYRGLDLTVKALARRKPEDQLRCVVVHGFAPSDEESPEGKAEIAEVRFRAYRSFSEHVYCRGDEDLPAEDDDGVAHFPWRLRRNPSLERFTSIASVLQDLRTEQHRALLRRVVELCAPEGEPADDEERA